MGYEITPHIPKEPNHQSFWREKSYADIFPFFVFLALFKVFQETFHLQGKGSHVGNGRRDQPVDLSESAGSTGSHGGSWHYKCPHKLGAETMEEGCLALVVA